MNEKTPTEAVRELIEAGWSEARIAAKVETSQPTIHRIKNGHSKIDFTLGCRLIQLAGLVKAANDDTGPGQDDATTEGAS